MKKQKRKNPRESKLFDDPELEKLDVETREKFRRMGILGTFKFEY